MKPFAVRLRARIDEHGPLCVGIDPSASVLAACGLPDTAEGAFEFGKRVLEAADYALAIVKPQSAVFERFGSSGVRALEEIAALARRHEVLVLLDGKRGDIDSTGLAYAQAFFAPDSPLRVDAATVHAYLGLGALDPFCDFAVKNAGGVFVVVRSSNPEGRELQTARLAGGESVATHLGREITARNRRYASQEPGGAAAGAGGPGPIGAVVGATCEDAAQSVAAMPASFVLAPGVGAQGATMQDILARMPEARGRVLPNVSRAILAGGAARADMKRTIERLKSEARQLL